VALVALVVVAARVDQAAAQAPARPAPQELWRQFPLDDAPSKSDARAERAASEQGRDGSLSTVQIAAIVLAMGLLLMLTTGVLAYATRAQFDLDLRGAGRRLRRPWRSRAVPEALRAGGRQRSADELAALEEALASYLAGRVPAESLPDDELERLKAKLDVYPATETGVADHELEVLKAKRGAPGGSVGRELPDDVETLKAKLAGNAVATERDTARNVGEAKSRRRGAAPKTRPKEAAGAKQRQKRVGRR
jgi:hypothetical protein